MGVAVLERFGSVRGDEVGAAGQLRPGDYVDVLLYLREDNLNPQASAQVAAVIAVSQALLERVCAHGYFENAQRHVVHNRARPPAVVASEPRADGPLRFGYIGTLSPNKGVGWLLQQFNELGIDARLVIAGRGKLDYEAELKALADPAKVSFVGYRDSASFLQGIDVLVVPSLWEEPFGLVAVEACASGVPVIAILTSASRRRAH